MSSKVYSAVVAGIDAFEVEISKSLFVLVVATSLVALMSEFLVGAVEAARATLGLSEVFVGVVVIAVIGNAAEHSTAVVMAMKNKMGLSLGIAVGPEGAAVTPTPKQ